jgi:hypothetical protein
MIAKTGLFRSSTIRILLGRDAQFLSGKFILVRSSHSLPILLDQQDITAGHDTTILF